MAALITWFALLPDTRGTAWRIDEAHKVSETYALRLVLEGRWNDPAWTANIIDRTNPPFGKYAFGLGVLAAGEELPRVPSLSRLAPDGRIPALIAGEDARPYRALLIPCRRVSLLATALTAGLIAFVAARLHSMLAALIAFLWGASHGIVTLFATQAIFDPLLTFLVLLTLPVVLFAKRPLVVAPLLGVICAMAFQTRLNGGIALAAVIAVLAWKEWKAAVIVGITFGIATVAMNPYYWGGVHRLTQQIADLRTLLHGITAGGVRLPSARTLVPWTLLEKTRFTWMELGGTLLVPAIAGCFFARAQRGLLVWCAVVIAGTFIWLPLPWPRYLLVMLPPLSILAGIAWADVFARAFMAMRRRA